MKLNNGNCHLLLSGYKHEMVRANIGLGQIWKRREQKLDVIIDKNNMKFDEYILTQCKKAGKKLCAPGAICQFLTKFFGYCSQTWMFSSRISNSHINHQHDWALRIFYNDHS